MNTIVKTGLIIIAASLSTIAGNYLRGGLIQTSSVFTLEPGMYGGFLTLLRSYDQRLLVDFTRGKLEVMVFRLSELLGSGLDQPEKALIRVAMENSGEIVFKPERRGFYAVAFRNLGGDRIDFGYTLISETGAGFDFIMDSLIMALVGAVILLMGLAVEVFSRRRKVDRA